MIISKFKVFFKRLRDITIPVYTWEAREGHTALSRKVRIPSHVSSEPRAVSFSPPQAFSVERELPRADPYSPKFFTSSFRSFPLERSNAWSCQPSTWGIHEFSTWAVRLYDLASSLVGKPFWRDSTMCSYYTSLPTFIKALTEGERTALRSKTHFFIHTFTFSQLFPLHFILLCAQHLLDWGWAVEIYSEDTQARTWQEFKELTKYLTEPIACLRTTRTSSKKQIKQRQ